MDVKSTQLLVGIALGVLVVVLGNLVYRGARRRWHHWRYGTPVDHSTLLVEYGRRMSGALDRQALAALLTAAAGCSSSRLTVKKGYDFARVHSVAVLSFPDARQLPESGMIVSDLISQNMMETGLTVVERTQLERLLEETSFHP